MISKFKQELNRIMEELSGAPPGTVAPEASASNDPEVKRAQDQLKTATIRSKEKELIALKKSTF